MPAQERSPGPWRAFGTLLQVIKRPRSPVCRQLVRHSALTCCRVPISGRRVFSYPRRSSGGAGREFGCLACLKDTPHACHFPFVGIGHLPWARHGWHRNTRGPCALPRPASGRLRAARPSPTHGHCRPAAGPSAGARPGSLQPTYVLTCTRQSLTACGGRVHSVVAGLPRGS